MEKGAIKENSGLHLNFEIFIFEIATEPVGITKKPLFLLDVREPHEFQISRIPGSTLIPLGDVPKRWQEIPNDQEIVIHCKAGIRSAKALLFLQQQGYKNLLNLKGGIDAWVEEVDPSLPRY